MSKAVAGAGAVIALASVLAIGAVAYDTGETPHGHETQVEGLYYWAVVFEYPDGTTYGTNAWDYTGDNPSMKFTALGYRLNGNQYPDPPEGYEWDHGPDYRYTGDTTVRAIPAS